MSTSSFSLIVSILMIVILARSSPPIVDLESIKETVPGRIEGSIDPEEARRGLEDSKAGPDPFCKVYGIRASRRTPCPENGFLVEWSPGKDGQSADVILYRRLMFKQIKFANYPKRK